jgi:hypothetical protein
MTDYVQIAKSKLKYLHNNIRFNVQITTTEAPHSEPPFSFGGHQCKQHFRQYARPLGAISICTFSIT